MGSEVWLGGGCVVLGNGERASRPLEPMNDLRLNELCLKIRQNADKLPMLQREQMERALFLNLMDIQRASEDALHRLNELKPK